MINLENEVCPFCNKHLVLSAIYNNADAHCPNCPYSYLYSKSTTSPFHYWNFYVGKYNVYSHVFDNGISTSSITSREINNSVVVCRLNVAIKPCSEEKLKLYILFS
jgi:transcription elongation factor Elf1